MKLPLSDEELVKFEYINEFDKLQCSERQIRQPNLLQIEAWLQFKFLAVTLLAPWYMPQNLNEYIVIKVKAVADGFSK